jgi:hypothetical protein
MSTPDPKLNSEPQFNHAVSKKILLIYFAVILVATLGGFILAKLE